jgi:S-formylglutathione hydrolase
MKLALFTALAASLLIAQDKGQVQRIKVHGVGLEGNLSGDSPDRDVTVYLPPSYAKKTRQRYPVVYLLHGFTDSDEKWMGFKKHFINVPEVIDKVGAELIVVMPNAFTRFQGSMYSSSAAIGDWEGFVANELVAYIDSHYRTLAKPESRGLAGHSMGGYGAIRIAMKRPGIYSSVYAMSPCCLAAPNPQPGPSRAESVKTDEEIAKADFGTKAALASAAAWSANPKNPPLFIDLPVKDGVAQPSVIARWAANAPVAMAGQYIGNLKRLKAIAIDMGDKDRLMPGAKDLVSILEAHGVPHSFEVYDGDHVNHVSDRVETSVLAFFTRHLAGK